MNPKLGMAACGLAMALATACGGGETPPPESPASKTTSTATSTTSSSSSATFRQQVAEGQKLYAENCASCHGASGEGGKAPRVVGVAQGALPLEPPSTSKYRKSQFHTAADVASFVVQTMPPKGPKLAEDQYWAILAFDLEANGVDLGSKHLDATTAPSVVLHP